VDERELDLERVRELLPEQPPPSRGSQAKARARLLRLAGRRRRPMVRFAAVGIAAAAVLALLLGPLYLTGVLDRRDDPQAIDPAVSPSSAASDTAARNVLLGAARQVDALQPEPVGAYWHVRSLISVPRSVGSDPEESRLIEENWTARDSGQSWSGSCGLDGKPTPCRLGEAGVGFALGERSNVDYAAVEALPDDVEGLRQYLLKHRPAEAGESDQWLFSSASALLADLPASPQVRAAAFRLLAGLPGVVSQGTVQDSQGRSGTAIALLDNGSGVDSTLQLVVDPGSGKLLSRRLNAVSSTDGKPVKRATITYLSVGWTNQKPVRPSRELN
jgi:hypothetical protein